MTVYQIYLDTVEERAPLNGKPWTPERVIDYAFENGMNGRMLAEYASKSNAEEFFKEAKSLCKTYTFYNAGLRWIHAEYIYVQPVELDADGEIMEDAGEVESYYAAPLA